MKLKTFNVVRKIPEVEVFISTSEIILIPHILLALIMLTFLILLFISLIFVLFLLFFFVFKLLFYFCFLCLLFYITLGLVRILLLNLSFPYDNFLSIHLSYPTHKQVVRGTYGFSMQHSSSRLY